MIVHRKIIETKKTFRLRPFGDLQKGSIGFQRHLWERWKQETIEDKDSYVIGLGDYSDSFRPTIQKRLQAAFIDDHESGLQLDDMIDHTTDQLAREMEPFKDRIIGLLEGHHFHTNMQGISSTQILCQKLGVPFLSFCSAIELVVRGGSKNSFAIHIYAVHGEGGARKLSADLRQMEQDIMPNWIADIYIRGHSTRCYGAPMTPLSEISQNRGMGKPFIKERKRWLINSGGFMSAYLEGSSSYVERAQMPKVQLGWVVAEIKPGNHQTGGNRFEVSMTTYAPT